MGVENSEWRFAEKMPSPNSNSQFSIRNGQFPTPPQLAGGA
jgi:hypothetical protein